MKKRILCIESGSVGGGSAQSLYYHIMALEKKFEFIAFFTARNGFTRQIENMGIKAYYFTSSIYNQEYRSQHYVKTKVLNFLVKIFSALFPFILIDQFVFFGLYKNVSAVIKKEKIDLVHTNNQPNRDFYAIYASCQNGIPVIAHVRSLSSDFFGRAKLNYCNKYVRNFIFYTENSHRHWVARGVDSSKSFVIHNASERINHASGLLRGVVKAGGEIRIITLMGRIRPERGYEFIFDALSLYLKKYPIPIVFNIVGDAKGFEKYFLQLQDRVRHQGLNSIVFFRGFSNSPLHVIAESDLLILPYTNEVFGRVVLDAWQIGTPIAMSNVGGIDQIVRDGVDCLLFDYGDREGCAHAIYKILSDAFFARVLVENGLKKFNSGYSIDVYGVKMNSIYARLFIDEYII